ncbi:hypothetical protein ACFQ3Z_40290 [Streptomyces nogalater]
MSAHDRDHGAARPARGPGQRVRLGAPAPGRRTGDGPGRRARAVHPAPDPPAAAPPQLAGRPPHAAAVQPAAGGGTGHRQPVPGPALLAAELLFTLAVGSVVFRRRPDARTWLAFVALAGGLALFLLAAAPTAGRDIARPGAWLLGGGGVLGAVVLLWLAARPVRGASGPCCSAWPRRCASPPRRRC